MNDEIKEIIKFQDILNYYKAKQIEPTYCEELITTGELQHLLDYITNLQVENKFAKEYEKQYRITKSRNEKAIEYLPEVRKTPSYELDEKIDNLENILNGGDE